MVGTGRRGGGCAPGRVVGRANAKGGGRGPDMDKLKKVLSGQDTEDRSGLSEVRAPGELAFLGKLPCCPRPAALSSAGTQPQVAARALWKAWLSNPPHLPSEGLEVLKQDLRNRWSGSVGPGASWNPGTEPHPSRTGQGSPLELGEAGGLSGRIHRSIAD